MITGSRSKERWTGMRNSIVRTKGTRRALLVALGVLLLAVPGFASSPEDCAMCHDDIAAEFAATPHILAKAGAPTCQTCHGEGEQHMDEGDASLIEKPAGSKLEALCLSCHAADVGHPLAGSGLHGAQSVYCDSCHQIHPGQEVRPRLLRDKPLELCSSCHVERLAEFHRPHGHELDDAGMTCVDCHNPHQQLAPAPRTHAFEEGTCVTCHAEKRGPFVFSHVSGVTGDCLTCHEAHGSNNPMALARSQVRQLCLECPSMLAPGLLGSQAVSSHDLRSPRYRHCTVCHVAVHGSNSSPSLLR